MSDDDKPRRAVRVSRSGMTTCPVCGRVVHVGADITAATCAHCGASALAAPTIAPAPVRFGKRGALLFAALLGPGLAHCDDASSAHDAAVADIADAQDATDTGPPEDTTSHVDVTQATDLVIVDVYGAPPDDAFFDAEVAPTDADDDAPEAAE